MNDTTAATASTRIRNARSFRSRASALALDAAGKWTYGWCVCTSEDEQPRPRGTWKGRSGYAAEGNGTGKHGSFITDAVSEFSFPRQRQAFHLQAVSRFSLPFPP